MPRRLISFDWAIKKLLRSKANFGILEGFLSELLFEDITILEILESEGNQEIYNDKYNRVDIKVKNSKEEIILIEIQYGRELDYMHRILYGTSKVITEHMREGEAYSKIVKVISINILYFDFGEGDDYIYKGTTVFKGLHNHSILKLNPRQRKLYNTDEVAKIYPEYYVIKVNNFNEIAKDSLDEWIYFLKTEQIESDFKAQGLQEAKEKLDYMKADKTEQKRYENFKRELHDKASEWEGTYVIGKMEGMKEGEMKGKIEGKIEGIKEGKLEGEKLKSIEIAKNLLDVLDVETIALKTKLSVEEIEGLKNLL